MNTINTYLDKYYEIQSEILLVYRPTQKSSWGNRVLFLGEGYDAIVPYNHRSVLKTEIVIEYDTDDLVANRKFVDEIARRLKKDGIEYAKWYSGNKSTHLHCFIDVKNAKNIQLLKKCFMRVYTVGLPIPDLRLATNNHLVRGEYGIHEKTGKHKSLISKTPNYPLLGTISTTVWEYYYKQMSIVVKRRTTIDTKDLMEHKGLQYILATHKFKESNDGRERALFMLIHLLKPRYSDKKEFTKYLIEWYRYSGGTSLTDRQIASKVWYHWSRNYNIGIPFLNELLESIGREDLIQVNT